MATYNVPAEELAQLLTDEPRVWARVGAVRFNGKFVVRLLELVTGEPPPSWRSVTWTYPDACFFAVVRKGTSVARWLRTRRLRIGLQSLSLEEMAAQATRGRRESQWHGGVHEPLSWPTETWRFDRTENWTNPVELLIGDGSPSFASFDAAASSLLGIRLTGMNLSGGEFMVRRQDTRARLTVRVHAAEIRVFVEGHELAGAVVELAGEQPGPTVRLARNRPKLIAFPIPDGIPPGAWLLLRRQNEWLDRKGLDRRYWGQQHGGVEFQVEPTTQVELLVSAGEGPTIELKAEVPTTDAQTRGVMKTVAAFANGEGGTILFGVSDDLEIHGLPESESDGRARDRITNLVQSWVSPVPGFGIEAVPVPDRAARFVVVLEVAAGDNPPYAMGTRPTNYTYYLRRGSNSSPATPAEVGAFVRAHARATSGGHSLGSRLG